jgi:putative peptidoglycan lipid II flippase
MTATAFMILSAGIVIIPMRDLFTKIFFGKENMKIPILTSTLYLIVFIAGCLALVPNFRYIGIAASSTLASLISFLFLVYRFGKLDVGSKTGALPIAYFLKIFLSSALASGAGYSIYSACAGYVGKQIVDYVLVIVSIGLSFAMYVALIKLLKIREIDFVYEKMAAKFKLRKNRGAVVSKG